MKHWPALLMLAIIPLATSCNGDDDESLADEPLPIDVNGHDYVDLGLSSGLLWATCNVGAELPQDCGDYFAWGETVGYNGGKDDFNWPTYKHCDGRFDLLTKYCTSAEYGTVDNLTTLESADDAAAVNWGGSWRMPTHDEMQELKNSCSWTWTELGGVLGYKVVGANGNYIFLPAAGYYNGTSLDNEGAAGNYWSSTLATGLSFAAQKLYVDANSVDLADANYRCCGRSVRAVIAQ